MPYILIPSICQNVPHSHSVAIFIVPHSHSINMSMVSVSYSHIIDVSVVSYILILLLSTWCPIFSWYQYIHNVPPSHSIDITLVFRILLPSICSGYCTFSHHCCLVFLSLLWCVASLHVHVILFSSENVCSCKPCLIKSTFQRQQHFKVLPISETMVSGIRWSAYLNFLTALWG